METLCVAYAPRQAVFHRLAGNRRRTYYTSEERLKDRQAVGAAKPAKKKKPYHGTLKASSSFIFL
jgi:hypothetical protein